MTIISKDDPQVALDKINIQKKVPLNWKSLPGRVGRKQMSGNNRSSTQRQMQKGLVSINLINYPELQQNSQNIYIPKLTFNRRESHKANIKISYNQKKSLSLAAPLCLIHLFCKGLCKVAL